MQKLYNTALQNIKTLKFEMQYEASNSLNQLMLLFNILHRKTFFVEKGAFSFRMKHGQILSVSCLYCFAYIRDCTLTFIQVWVQICA